MVWNEYAHAAERMSDNEYSDDDEYEIQMNKPLHIDDWGGHSTMIFGGCGIYSRRMSATGISNTIF